MEAISRIAAELAGERARRVVIIKCIKRLDRLVGVDPSGEATTRAAAAAGLSRCLSSLMDSVRVKRLWSFRSSFRSFDFDFKK